MVRYVIYLFGGLAFKFFWFLPFRLISSLVWFWPHFISFLPNYVWVCGVFWLILFKDVTKSINKSYVISCFFCFFHARKRFLFDNSNALECIKRNTIIFVLLNIILSLKVSSVACNVFPKQSVPLWCAGWRHHISFLIVSRYI